LDTKPPCPSRRGIIDLKKPAVAGTIKLPGLNRGEGGK
jgi:hypothetical protein